VLAGAELRPGQPGPADRGRCGGSRPRVATARRSCWALACRNHVVARYRRPSSAPPAREGPHRRRKAGRIRDLWAWSPNGPAHRIRLYLPRGERHFRRGPQAFAKFVEKTGCGQPPADYIKFGLSLEQRANFMFPRRRTPARRIPQFRCRKALRAVSDAVASARPRPSDSSSSTSMRSARRKSNSRSTMRLMEKTRARGRVAGVVWLVRRRSWARGGWGICPTRTVQGKTRRGGGAAVFRGIRATAKRLDRNPRAPGRPSKAVDDSRGGWQTQDRGAGVRGRRHANGLKRPGCQAQEFLPPEVTESHIKGASSLGLLSIDRTMASAHQVKPHHRSSRAERLSLAESIITRFRALDRGPRHGRASR